MREPSQVNSSTMPALAWKCDTSNDEVVGHFFAYLAVAEVLAEAPAERATIVGLVDGIMSTIVAHNYTLVDITGNATTWGHFGAVEITGFLLVAHRVTGKQAYLDALRPLLARGGPFAVGFPGAVANAQRLIPAERSFSDDELDFLAYWNLLIATADRNSSLVRAARRGIARSWDAVAGERAGLWDTMALAALMRTGGIPAAPRGLGRARDPAVAVADTLWSPPSRFGPSRTVLWAQGICTLVKSLHV
jgi:hypothetical protein